MKMVVAAMAANIQAGQAGRLEPGTIVSSQEMAAPPKIAATTPQAADHAGPRVICTYYSKTVRAASGMPMALAGSQRLLVGQGKLRFDLTHPPGLDDRSLEPDRSAE